MELNAEKLPSSGTSFFPKTMKKKSTILITKPALVLEKSLWKQLGLKGLLKDNNADLWPPPHPFFNGRMALLQGQREKRGMSGHNLPSIFPLLGLVLRVAQYRQPRKKLEQKLGGGVVEEDGVTFRGVTFFFFGHTVHKHFIHLQRYLQHWSEKTSESVLISQKKGTNGTNY